FNSLGLLLGVGGAAIFSLNKVHHPERIEGLYSELIIFCVGLGILFAIIGNLFPHQILTLMGANQQTINMATTYVRIVSCVLHCLWQIMLLLTLLEMMATPH